MTKDQPHPKKTFERIIDAHNNGDVDVFEMTRDVVIAKMGEMGIRVSKNSVTDARKKLPGETKLGVPSKKAYPWVSEEMASWKR